MAEFITLPNPLYGDLSVDPFAVKVIARLTDDSCNVWVGPGRHEPFEVDLPRVEVERRVTEGRTHRHVAATRPPSAFPHPARGHGW